MKRQSIRKMKKFFEGASRFLLSNEKISNEAKEFFQGTDADPGQPFEFKFLGETVLIYPPHWEWDRGVMLRLQDESGTYRSWSYRERENARFSYTEN